MRNALSTFHKNINAARELTALYDHLKTSIIAPLSFDDLLRSQVVYSVSAFDKLIHDLVRIGMVATFTGARLATARYQAEAISMQLHGELVGATVPPKEYLFEQEIIKRLRVQAFQEPVKVAAALSLIWDEAHKWLKIGKKIGVNPDDARTKVRLIVTRRNAIVHEADIDPISQTQNTISRAECKDITDFLELCGNGITELVI
jgi:hypothetical protein